MSVGYLFPSRFHFFGDGAPSLTRKHIYDSSYLESGSAGTICFHVTGTATTSLLPDLWCPTYAAGL